jgi:hypothetical protein
MSRRGLQQLSFSLLIRFIIPAPSTSMFDFILFEKLWIKGIFCYRRLIPQIIQLTCSQNVSQGSSSNIVWTWSTSLGVEHLQGAAPYGALEAALIDHEDWTEKSCQGGNL